MISLRPRLVALAAVLLTPAALTAAPATSAAPDVTAPTAVSFDFSPDRIDLSKGPQSITVTARITDESGLDGLPFIIVASESTTQTQGFGEMTRVSGNASDGTYARTVTIPANAAPGNWRVSLYPLEDVVGNRTFFKDAPKPLVVRYGDAPPSAPTAVSATPGDRSAVVSWTAPPSDQPVTSYTVTSSPATAPVTVPGNATSAAISGLANGTAYTFTVVATSSVGDSPASQPSPRVTPSAAPAAPTSVRATPGDRSATLTWTPPADDGGSPLTAYTITVLPGGREVTVKAPATSATVDGLNNGAGYTFVVRAANARGVSTDSTPSAEVVPAGVPLRMAAPATRVKKRTLTVTWGAADGNGQPVSGYVVSWNAKSRTLPATARSVKLSNLKPGKYRVSVRARNAAGLGSLSPVRTVRIR